MFQNFKFVIKLLSTYYSVWNVMLKRHVKQWIVKHVEGVVFFLLQMLGVRCHMSSVTFHVSCFSQRLSPVTFHLSPVVSSPPGNGFLKLGQVTDMSQTGLGHCDIAKIVWYKTAFWKRVSTLFLFLFKRSVNYYHYKFFFHLSARLVTLLGFSNNLLHWNENRSPTL